MCTTQYSYGDVSGSGFGALWEDQGGEKKHRKGNWGKLWLGSLQTFMN